MNNVFFNCKTKYYIDAYFIHVCKMCQFWNKFIQNNQLNVCYTYQDKRNVNDKFNITH